MFFVVLCPGAGSLLQKPILVTHIRTVLRTYSRKVLILISTVSGCLDIGQNLHHQALLLLCVHKYGSDHHCKLISLYACS